ncbi:MAG: ACT domain-containing protein [bacterium]
MFSENDINIEAITVVDTVDHAVDRIIVDKPDEATELLKDRGLLVVDHDVLAFDLENRPGALGEVADLLAEHDINIEYAYCTVEHDHQHGLMIAKVSNPHEALELIQSAEAVEM